MKKLTFDELNTQQMIDIRPQREYQKGHLPQSLNLNLGNFKKYATVFLSKMDPVLFIIDEDSEESITELEEVAKGFGFGQIDGAIPITEIPTDKLQQLETISAENFLSLKDDFILLDVRHPDEITRPAPETHLMNIPIEHLVDEVEELDQSKTIYTVCGSGNRGTAAASYLATKGFKPIVIAGGMKAVEEVRN